MIFKTKYTINPNLDIAFGILSHVGVDRYVSVDFLSRTLECSMPTIKHTGKFLLLLSIIETKKGTGGGYRLTRPLNEIYLRDLLPLVRAERDVLQHTFRLVGDISVKDFLAQISAHNKKNKDR